MLYTAPLHALSMADISRAGGKGASLGEMIQHLTDAGVRVPGGFVILSDAVDANWDEVEGEIRQQYATMGSDLMVAVRSSAVAEDSADASYAGQHDTVLGVVGIDAVLDAVEQVYASVHSAHAASYRQHTGAADASMAVVVQQLVRADHGTAGVAFSADPESGFGGVVVISASYGLGEAVVSGAVDADEFVVSKTALVRGLPAVIRRHVGGKEQMVAILDGAARSIPVNQHHRRKFAVGDLLAQEIAELAVEIERHYETPMDIEWAHDGIQLYVVQARPMTTCKQAVSEQTYTIKPTVPAAVTGRAVGRRVACGPVRVVRTVRDIDQVQSGEVLVTDMTTPDWEPAMRKAAAIVTDRGGRTCHAAIIAREIGLPAVVGCGNATSELRTGDVVTVSCAEGDVGNVYLGEMPYTASATPAPADDYLYQQLMMTVGNPSQAFALCQQPNDGVGLARLEFLISQTIGVHPRAVLAYPEGSGLAEARICEEAAAYGSPQAWYTEKISEGVATLAAAFWPKPVIVRFSDFKSNEYRALPGGEIYEPTEENPMIGMRGAARYVSSSFSECFEMECDAIREVRDIMGFTNVQVMVPFVRTLDEADRVLAAMQRNGLKSGENELKILMMCEIPSNAILAAEFLKRFDGMSIGSNDLTQLTLGVDRDAGGELAESFSERNEAVLALISMAVDAGSEAGKYVGICGQGPSDSPEFALWLAHNGIDSMSLSPDSIARTRAILQEGT